MDIPFRVPRFAPRRGTWLDGWFLDTVDLPFSMKQFSAHDLSPPFHALWGDIPLAAKTLILPRKENHSIATPETAPESGQWGSLAHMRTELLDRLSPLRLYSEDGEALADLNLVASSAGVLFEKTIYFV